jgi:hypothetical protein
MKKQSQKNRKHRTKTQKRTRAQRGGDGWGFTGPAFTPVGAMTPEASRTVVDHCLPVEGRPVPVLTQQGGACMTCGPSVFPSAQRGGGAGTGGYGVNVSSNELGKVYTSATHYPCPSQKGGAEDSFGLVSYPTGYGYNTRSVQEVGGAHFLSQNPYNKTCAGGGARRKTHRRKSRKSRK